MHAYSTAYETGKIFNDGCNIVITFFCLPSAGADFTNTFRSLSLISCPTEENSDGEEDSVKKATDLLIEQCASLEELKAVNKPTMDPR